MNDSSPASNPPPIDPPPDGLRFCKFSLGSLMILVAIVAIDFGMLAAMWREGPFLWQVALLIVLSYDYLFYCTILALGKMIQPAPGERPSLVLLGIAVLVLVTCVGVPVGFMLMILLSSPR